MLALTRHLCQVVDEWACSGVGLPEPARVVQIIRRSERLRTAARFVSRHEPAFNIPLLQGEMMRFLQALPSHPPIEVRLATSQLVDEVRRLQDEADQAVRASIRRSDEDEQQRPEELEQPPVRPVRLVEVGLVTVAIVLMLWAALTSID
ncbi:MAG: hypothetical protein ACK50G_02230 [bacterium]